MSGYIEDEARVTAWFKYTKRRTTKFLEQCVEKAPNRDIRKAAVNELLRRKIMGGKG